MSTEINQGSNRETPRHSTLGNGRFTNGKWFCGCNIEAALRTVKKDIPTKGKKFWRCPKVDEQDEQCSFYIWLDHETAVKESLKVSRQPPVPQTPTRTGVAYNEPGPSTVSGLRDKQSLLQVPETPFTTLKRKRVLRDITTHDDGDDDFDGRLDVNVGPRQATMAMDDPFANPRHHSEHTRTALAAGVSQEEKEQFVQDFTRVICEKFRSRQLKFSMSAVSQERAKRVFASKLKRYSRAITDDTPKTVEFTRRRNAAKVVFWYRTKIVDEFVRMTFPALEQEQETERVRTVWTNDTVQESSEAKVIAWRMDSADFYEDPSGGPADTDDNSATQKLDDAMEMYPRMEFEPVEDDQGPVTARDYKVIREYLTTHEEFDILESELEKVAKHYCGDTMKLIQTSILGTLGASTTCFKANFEAQWNVDEFIKEQYNYELQDIGQILTITGNCHDAQMTTLDCYLKQTWPSHPNALTDKLQFSTSRPNPNEQKEEGVVLCSALNSREINDRVESSQLVESSVRVFIAKDTVSVNATGSAEFLCIIGQQLAWLGAVCRLSKNGLCYCDTVWNHDQSEVYSDENTFKIEYNVISFDKNETKPCWHSLIGDSVVATGFPTPERSYEDKGLQVPVEIMAALGGVSLAVNVGSGFVLKGATVAFIPVARKEDRVQWHLVKSDGGLLTYEYLEEQGVKPLTLNTLNGKEINSTTAFLGWTPHVINLAATEKIEYSQIKPSGSDATPEIAITPSGGNLTIAKIVGVGLTFQIGRKQPSPATRAIKEYSDILHDLRDRSVIFYDTDTRRSWLIDAERATLQIILHRSKTRKNYIAPDVKFEIANPEQAASAHSAMESNQQVKLRKGWEAAEGKEMDVWFSASVKEMWEILQALAYKAQSENKRGLRLANWNLEKKAVVGFEYMGLVDSSADLVNEPMIVQLDADCGKWPELANDLGAVILLARNFQEVLLPRDEASLCPTFRKLPSKKSYLAIEAATILKLIKQFSAHNGQKRLTATNMEWIVSESVFTPCNQQNEWNCPCKRVQELGKHSKSRSDSLGGLWEGGAIIFGARVTNRLRKKGPETDKRQRTPSRGPEAVSSLIAATSVLIVPRSLPSTQMSPNEDTSCHASFLGPGRRLGQAYPRYLQAFNFDFSVVNANERLLVSGSSHESAPLDPPQAQADGQHLSARDAARGRWADVESNLSPDSEDEQHPELDFLARGR